MLYYEAESWKTLTPVTTFVYSELYPNTASEPTVVSVDVTRRAFLEERENKRRKTGQAGLSSYDHGCCPDISKWITDIPQTKGSGNVIEWLSGITDNTERENVVKWLRNTPSMNYLPNHMKWLMDAD